MNLLKVGDAIGVVAPGSPFPRDVLEKGLSVLRKMGFKTKLGNHVFSVTGHTAGSPRNRAEDINNFFLNPKVGAIIAVRGGYTCNQLLSHLDYNLIRKNAKPFLGLSDVTAILNAISTRAGIVTFHAPVLLMIGGGKDGKAFSSYSQENFTKMMSEGEKNKAILENNSESWRVLKRGVAKGKLFGGNLTSLSSIVGTPYEPEWEGSILFWEAVEERIELLDQMLTHLKLAGYFSKINGMIIGRLTDIKTINGIASNSEIVQMIVRQCEETDFPIIYGVDFGHVNDNLVLPVGAEVSFDTKDSFIKVFEF